MAAIWTGASGFRIDAPFTWFETPGDIAGSDVMHCAALFVVPTLGAARGLIGCRSAADATVGWSLWISAANALTFSIRNAAGTSISTPTLTLTTADVGKILYAVAAADGGLARLYCKRVQQGATSAALVGYKPATGSATTMGVVQQVSGVGLSDHLLLGASCGRTCPALAHIQASHDAVMVEEEIRPIPGYTEHLWSLKAPGSLATVQDRVGSATMTQVGTLTAAPWYCRAFSW